MEIVRPLIWVIDPSATVRAIVSVLLSREGGQVVEYAEPVQVLRAIKAGARPDVLILDLALPTLSGYEVIFYLRTALQLKQMAIIALVQHGGLASHLKARLAGANACLAKPFTREQLLATVIEHSPH